MPQSYQPRSSPVTFAHIVKDQGFTALWRGNNANIYRNLALITLRVGLYDKIKQGYFPHDPSKYSGIDYYWRAVAQSAMIIGVTTAFTYPLDLIHTRMVIDMSSKGQPRTFTTTFDCFNRTNIDEGLKTGVYKGWKISAVSSVVRSAITLPMLDLMRAKANTKEDNYMSRFTDKIGIAMIASVATSLLLYPIDTMKRCWQVNGARGRPLVY